MRRIIPFNRRRRIMVPRTRPTTRSIPDNTHQVGNPGQATIPNKPTTTKATTRPNRITTTTTNKPPSKPNYFQGTIWSKYPPQLYQRSSQFIINKLFMYIKIPKTENTSVFIRCRLIRETVTRRVYNKEGL